MKELSIIPDNNWSKPRNSWYTLSNTLIVHSLRTLSPHRPGDDNLPFQWIISSEQRLPCACLASCRICLVPSLLFSNHSQHLQNFLWSSLCLQRGHLSKCCCEALYFNFKLPCLWSWHIPFKIKKNPCLCPAAYHIKHSYMPMTAAGRFAKPAGHTGKCGHTGYHYQCPTN